MNLPRLLGKAIAFLRKDLIAAASYRLAFLGQIAGIVFSALTLYFLSRLFEGATIPALARYGGDYFAFVLVGVAFAGYLHFALTSFSGAVRNAQVMGTLEALLITQTGIPTIILFSSLYAFFMTTLRILLYLVVGTLLLGMSLGKANAPMALVTLVLTVVTFSSLGILSASFIMVLKKGSPVNWIFNSLSWLLGGVFYPVDVLPPWAQRLAALLPITYALEAMRMAVLKGHTASQLAPTLLPLAVFAVLLLPVSLLAFSWAVRYAKTQGSLTQY